MGLGSAGKKGPRQMVNIQALPSGSRMVHPDEQEIGKRGQQSSMNELRTSVKTHYSRTYTGGRNRDRPLGINIEMFLE